MYILYGNHVYTHLLWHAEDSCMHSYTRTNEEGGGGRETETAREGERTRVIYILYIYIQSESHHLIWKRNLKTCLVTGTETMEEHLEKTFVFAGRYRATTQRWRGVEEFLRSCRERNRSCLHVRGVYVCMCVSVCSALWLIYRALLRIYRALLRISRTLHALLVLAC